MDSDASDDTYYFFEEKADKVLEVDGTYEQDVYEEELPFFRQKLQMVFINHLNKILVYGGNCLGLTLNDFWLLDVKNMEWEAIEVEQLDTKVKKGLQGALAIYHPEQHLVYFIGGINQNTG